ncbi:MAG TPA: hypothetical protein VJJ51_12990 [Candidatus Methanoperedens sp.]|nr:hypothetical protein [Candidatus Methanoperedens sp.]HLB71952.1 hypothetical protein [Candidatus Methanoperedens sp.]
MQQLEKDLLMLELRQNKSLDTKIFMYAYKHKDNEKDLLKLSKQLKIRLSEDLMSSLRQLEEEKFLVSDPRIWKLTARGEAAAFVLESSQKKHLYLLLFCLPLCVVIVLTILAESL